MDRAERRDRTERKAKSRKRKLLDVVGVPCDEMRMFFKENQRFLDTEPAGKFRNNHVANEYASHGQSVKTNRRKGHSNYRSKHGAYGVAMNWKPHDQAQIDAMDDDEEELGDEKKEGRA